MRDKDAYDPKKAEEEQLQQYIKNYMQFDPKKLSDEEMEALMKKAK